jgi:processive 1,2-diacylglycerol beta-glucosyltransferase
MAPRCGMALAKCCSMDRVAILYTPAGGGHRAAANAIAAELSKAGTVVDVRNVLEFAPSWFAYDRAWQLIQRHGGHAWDWLFEHSERGLDLDAVRLPLHRALFGALDRYLIDFAPTHVVCTHYLPALAVTRVREQLAARVIVTITDHLAHRAWIVPGVDSYCVADAGVARAVRRKTRAEVIVTGIPIAACKLPVRGVAVELPRARVLALLGGVPKHEALMTIDALAPLSRHALHVLCGDDADVLAHARKRLPLAEIAARADGLYAAIDRADLVVTKAGGLTVSECLARGRAMVLPFAAPGQERGNLFYALDAGAAVRPSELADLADTIEGLVGEPGRLRKMGARARFAAHPDAAAAVVTSMFGEQAVARVA